MIQKKIPNEFIEKKKFTISNKTLEIEQIDYDENALKLWMFVVFVVSANKNEKSKWIKASQFIVTW